jgi:hypothetical protein
MWVSARPELAPELALLLGVLPFNLNGLQAKWAHWTSGNLKRFLQVATNDPFFGTLQAAPKNVSREFLKLAPNVGEARPGIRPIKPTFFGTCPRMPFNSQ